jgi:hypothetical protein
MRREVAAVELHAFHDLERRIERLRFLDGDDVASTVAVVVPSPATSDVLLATSLTIGAPMFSSGSCRSISFATVTRSLVMVGDPYAFPMMTLRPFGPSVTLTALARALTPRRIADGDDGGVLVIADAMKN